MRAEDPEHRIQILKCLEVRMCLKFNIEPPHDKTNKITFAPSEDSDQPGDPPSLIRVFAVPSVGS